MNEEVLREKPLPTIPLLHAQSSIGNEQQRSFTWIVLTTMAGIKFRAKVSTKGLLVYMLHPVAGRYPIAVILPIAVFLYNIW